MKRTRRPVIGTSLSGRGVRGHVHTTAGDKPPKRRWQPGQFAELEGQLYEVMYCYRLREDPREWVYCLEERGSVVKAPNTLIDHLEDALGCGSETPRVSYDVFFSYMDAFQFFSDIPRKGDSRHLPNKQMMKAKLVSSGLVEPKE